MFTREAAILRERLPQVSSHEVHADSRADLRLRINVKLGGINTIPDPRSVAALTDPKNPTIVMGCALSLARLRVYMLIDHLSSADVIHPAPGAEGRPSFTALVANVDSDTAKYVADCRVQTSRKELIEDLESMSQVRIPTGYNVWYGRGR